MAYWELLTVFVVDQDASITAYLEPFSQTGTATAEECNPSARITPNPWTGIATPVIILLAKVGNLIRRHRLISKIFPTLDDHSSCAELGSRENMMAHLQGDAAEFSQRLLEYCVPRASAVVDTLDERTSIRHLQDMAEVFRLAGILELIRAFPELAHAEKRGSGLHEMREGTFKGRESAGFLAQDLAISILTILSSIPGNSGVVIMQGVPLIIAASALGPSTPPSGPEEYSDAGREMSEVSCSGINTEVLQRQLSRIARRPTMVEHWRAFVRGRLGSLSKLVGLPAIPTAQTLIEAVWQHLDWETAVRPDLGVTIHWLDIMTEQRLESLFG